MVLDNIWKWVLMLATFSATFGFGGWMARRFPYKGTEEQYRRSIPGYRSPKSLAQFVEGQRRAGRTYTFFSVVLAIIALLLAVVGAVALVMK
jgi:hypothetical protein